MKKQPLPSITGILLAAGLSTRMGQPKQLMPFGESTIIETVVDNMINAKFNDITVIVGHCAEKIRDILKDRKVKIVYNPDYKEGMLTSVKKGVQSLQIDNRQRLKDNASFIDRYAFSLMLVDQPFITSELICKVIDAYSDTDKGIVLPSYNNRRGHPVIFSQRYVEDILALDTDSGGTRSLFNVYADDMYYVPVDTDAVLKDIDSPEDYKNVMKVVNSNEIDL